MKKILSAVAAIVMLLVLLPTGMLFSAPKASAYTVYMMTINGGIGNAQIVPGQAVTVRWSAPYPYVYCNTGVSPAYPYGWGSYINVNPSGSYTVVPVVPYMRFQLQCSKGFDQPMEIEGGVASNWIVAPPTPQCSDGIDNNGNGLIDEKGLTFTIHGNLVTVHLSLHRVDEDGKGIIRTLEMSLTIRN